MTDYSKSVLDVAQRIAGAVSGSGDGMADEHLDREVDWLEKRVGEGWDPNPHCDPNYDAAVQAMARAAVKMARQYRATVWGRAKADDGPASERAVASAASADPSHASMVLVRDGVPITRWIEGARYLSEILTEGEHQRVKDGTLVAMGADGEAVALLHPLADGMVLSLTTAKEVSTS